ncbi:uncharacterized protein LOC111623352 [Centruroides sculpturatus]|uniref:uncharacterized protein LOC111623352 n=1 Tax=Centruroides sculpturatus TaxID=218467 RepID=UPI000C6D818B|nr:uncharacterized protein LOC111623352 [Centruroides sculpturatus]
MSFIISICLAYLFYSTEGCECDFWKSLNHLSEFLYDIKLYLLKDVEVIYVFEKNCVLYDAINNLHDKNMTIMYFALQDGEKIHRLSSSLLTMNKPATPIYIMLFHCPLSFIPMIKSSIIALPMIRWLLFHTEDYSQYNCKVGKISVNNFSDVYFIKGPVIMNRNCNRLYLLAEWSYTKGMDSNSVVGLMDSTNGSFLMGQTLTAATLNVYPFFSKTENFFMNKENFSGIDFQMFHALSQRFKFK